MNCEVCGLKIRINWGSGHVALCEEHSDCAADLEQAKLTHAAHFAEDDGAPALASRWTRLCAACIDALITMAVTLPFMFYLDYWTVIAEQQAVPLELSIKVAIFSWAMFFLVHGYLLKKKGQTIGKNIMDIAIVTTDGHKPEFFPLITRRYFPVALVSYIPLVGQYLSLIDNLFIFRKDKRCVHDLIAGTKVIEVLNNKKISMDEPQETTSAVS
ncbi:RDD family protein [Aliamphritea spongicola]|uniref:RDD family protein n=1 Tax=Aliamphritea spongicola TaxID=707589 RepID=UPI00196B2CB1|nr:RDD family protein [Aliamphritea spongicola]MBN3563167.1 RDD family protein [Aliamphritea spongicola]